MLSCYTTALYSPQAFARYLRTLSTDHLDEAIKTQGRLLPTNYRRVLMDEIEYRRNSWSRGNEGGG